MEVPPHLIPKTRPCHENPDPVGVVGSVEGGAVNRKSGREWYTSKSIFGELHEKVNAVHAKGRLGAEGSVQLFGFTLLLKKFISVWICFGLF